MDLKHFRELLNPLPGNHYMQVSPSANDISKALYEMIQGVDGELSLAIYNENQLDYSLDFPNAKIKYINNFKEPFRVLPRSNDVIIIQDVFAKHENKDMIIKIAYTSLANAADIIIIEKKGVMDVQKLKDTLEEYEFRAANDIDILDGYDLVIAKKMHMWGNGL